MFEQVDREYVVQKALHSIDFPVPQPLLYCSDTNVIGTEFYIMEHVKVSPLSVCGKTKQKNNYKYYVLTRNKVVKYNSLFDNNAYIWLTIMINLFYKNKLVYFF